MVLQRITNPNLAAAAHTALLNEYVSAGLDPATCPGEGAIAAMLKDPNVFIVRDTLEPRIVVVAHREGTHWWVDQVFGPSAIHAKILLRICNFMIAQGFGAATVSYGRSGNPLTVIADNEAIDPSNIDADGKTATTTFNAARTKLLAAGVTP